MYQSQFIRHGMQAFAAFLNDDEGAVYITELVLTASILAVGSIVGLSAYQAAVVGEYSDLGVALSSLNQSYAYQIVTGGTTVTIAYNDSTPAEQPVTAVTPGLE